MPPKLSRGVIFSVPDDDDDPLDFPALSKPSADLSDSQAPRLSKSGTRVVVGRDIRELRERADEQFMQHQEGLSKANREAMAELRGSNFPRQQEDDDQAVMVDDGDPMWVPVGDFLENDDAFRTAIGEAVHQSGSLPRRYKDDRTWHRRVERSTANWAPAMDSLVEGYLQWRYGSATPSSTSNPGQQAATSLPPADHDVVMQEDNSYDFLISVVDLYTLSTTLHVPRTAEMTTPEALALQGYIPSTPLSPTIAISIKTLELFQRIRLCKASFSVEAFSKVLCDLYGVPYQRCQCNALSAAFDVYLEILRTVDKRVAAFLGRDSPNWRVLNSCPPCTYELEGEPHLTFTRMFAMDGNNSLKRVEKIGERSIGDHRVFEGSDYYLSEEYVNQFADEVKARKKAEDSVLSAAPSIPEPTPTGTESPRAAGEGGTSSVTDSSPLEGGQHAPEALPATGATDTLPATGNGPTSESVQSVQPNTDDDVMEAEPGDAQHLPEHLFPCANTWKNASADEKKQMWQLFREAGAFAGACRHGMILWIVDMVKSGELAKYPLALVAKALDTLGTRLLIGYDIGCAFSSTIASSSLGPKFQASGSRCCVNAFHGYSHNYLCQVHNHPNVIVGMGLEDLEVMEHIFSASNQLAPVIRYATRFRRRVLIDLFFRQWDDDKYLNLPTFLYDNYKQALKIIREDSIALEEAMKASHVLLTLGKETDYDVHAVAYVELLQKLAKLTRLYDDKTSSFLVATPSEYRSAEAGAGATTGETYGSELSKTRWLETEHKHLDTEHQSVLKEVMEFELKLGITTTWTPSTPEYINALTYKDRRDYDIVKALQNRSKTIQKAVKTYNAAALALKPPKPTIDWGTVSHFKFLEDFPLLRNTKADIDGKPWAKPVIREIIKQHHRLCRAREEITRCNVEIRRLHTYIIDEGKDFERALLRCTPAIGPLGGAVKEFIHRRTRANISVLTRLARIYKFEEFSGNSTPGVRKGQAPMDISEDSAVQPAVAASEHENLNVPSTVQQDRLITPHDIANDDSDSDSDGEGDTTQEGLVAIVDFVSQLSVKDGWRAHYISNMNTGEVCYVSVGGTQRGIHASMPFLSSRRNHPTFPIVFKCQSHAEASMLTMVNGLIERGPTFHGDVLNIAWFVFTDPFIMQICPDRHPFYPVYYAKMSLRVVFRDYRDVEPIVNGAVRPIFRRCEYFHEALVFMILRGQHHLLDDFPFTPKPYEERRSPRTSVGAPPSIIIPAGSSTPSSLPSVSSVSSVTSLDSQSTAASGKSASHPPKHATGAKGKKMSADPSNHQQLAITMTPATSKCPPTTRKPPANTANTANTPTATAQNSDSALNHLKASAATSTKKQPIVIVSSDSEIDESGEGDGLDTVVLLPKPCLRHRFIRSLAGIVGTVEVGKEGPIEDPPPLINKFLDHFFKCHGFLSSSIWTIKHASDHSKNRTDFIKYLTDRGAPRLEIEWIWEHLGRQE
ncbi:unnamed protein product [Cyclocybe aegerita]|uniref:Uncharacterized protein n=1 Tax=Cyclocybe aegerita TaxID=1973307 RepID=A0A8S0XRR0_CYCAE|nr:unnamed protein product [Cyclocybe aegerita]